MTSTAARQAIWAQTLDLVGDDLEVILLSAALVPDPAYTYVSEIAECELSGPGYVPGFGGGGRQDLDGRAITVDSPNATVILDADDVVFEYINAGTARYGVVARKGTSDDTDALVIATFDIEPTLGVTTDGSSLPIRWGANGVLTSRSVAA